MLFLVDENLPASVGLIFSGAGHEAQYVSRLKQLHGKPDEVVFDYAVKNRGVIVTRDLDFANPLRFELKKVPGMIILRFPNEILIRTLCDEVERVIKDFEPGTFNNLVIIEPGLVRIRPLKQKPSPKTV